MPIKQTVGGGGMNNTPDDVCGKYGSIKAPAQNHHPTVKPIELMRYLVRLTKTPTGGIVLDPFTGSGTTGIACVLEGREFIGIEREAEYVEIAEKRIAHYAMQPEQLRIE
jgi:site-specific DNA-methyltransferase (adenine-specific)